jgi:hypothetical protein
MITHVHIEQSCNRFDLVWSKAVVDASPRSNLPGHQSCAGRGVHQKIDENSLDRMYLGNDMSGEKAQG